ncbi:DUF1330 domain-containing protein [Marinomonas sp. 15G1-11]|uniref:DUF1330 domain-containing protein n=1 Tax=Marinomonas phaeophyticola TaxID=3004091 RepID=A0ABT4JT97_9GAMM|nr:DUF1330 domain-containing protein [Marinomonas sp. 15G1-11]MCZ2721406.1 DUF1330 domain-containing protein [Marinomonas sp. 15G1-11]
MFERLVGLYVSDDSVYQKYREGMIPILKAHNGFFRYDFNVSDTLINESGKPINRVFILAFPTEEVAERFFGNAEYGKVRSEFFDASVEHVTLISQYN